jgi:hypothetical protein
MSFTDGSSATVFRETVISRTNPLDPCVLVVKFELRGVRGRGQRAGAIDYRVVPAVRREDFVRKASPDNPVDWWQLAAISRQ